MFTALTVIWDLEELTGYQLAVELNMRNVMNMDTTIAVEQNDRPEGATTQFGQELAQMFPFSAQLGITFAY